MSPPNTVPDAAIRRAYERGAGEYDSKFRVLQWPKYGAVLGREGEHLIEWLARGRLLDLGCGTGLLAEFARECGLERPRWTGVDFAHAMLVRADARGIDCVRAPIDRLPFADASFDAVLSFTALALEPRDGEDSAALHEIARVLSPGGTFGITVLQTSATRIARRLEGTDLHCESTLACGQDAGFVGRRKSA